MTAKERNIKMIGHRGYSSKYHENTELAFIKAGEHASGGAETDIRVTKDGVLVCSHNSEIVLKDGTVLAVSDNDYSALTAQPLKNRKGDEDVYLCTFERYLEIMKEFDMVCFVELKGEFTEEQVAEVFAMAERKYELSKFILQSFSIDNLKKSRRQYPDIPLMYTYDSGCEPYDFCFEYGISIDTAFRDATPEMIEQFHSHGLEVALWTVNEPEDFEMCKQYDVEYIESDVFGGND